MVLATGLYRRDVQQWNFDVGDFGSLWRKSEKHRRFSWHQNEASNIVKVQGSLYSWRSKNHRLSILQVFIFYCVLYAKQLWKINSLYCFFVFFSSMGQVNIKRRGRVSRQVHLSLPYPARSDKSLLLESLQFSRILTGWYC